MAPSGLRLSRTAIIIKYLLFLFNTLFVLAGIALITVGAIAMKAKSVAGNAYDAALVLVILVGCAVFLVSIFGCLGAIREDLCMLTTFAAILSAIVIVEIAGVITIFVSSGTTSLQDNLKHLFKSAYDGNSAAIATVESAQKLFGCCGYNSTNYWSGSSHSSDLLASCRDSSTGSKYSATCKQRITHFLEEYGRSIGGVALVIALVEVIGIWLSLRLATAIGIRTSARREYSNRQNVADPTVQYW